MVKTRFLLNLVKIICKSPSPIYTDEGGRQFKGEEEAEFPEDEADNGCSIDDKLGVDGLVPATLSTIDECNS